MEQGMAEIQLMKDRLSASRRFSGSASEWLLPLHSSVASSDQRRVFQRPPSGNRKVGVTLNSWTDRFEQIYSKRIETKVLWARVGLDLVLAFYGGDREGSW